MEKETDKSGKLLQPIVAIDGNKIRKVREEKKLTQLYVASVVGVTTDTISRWENNRYPTIKRDNAEKLAGALEVELDEILQDEVADEPAEEVPPPAEVKRRWPVLLAAVLAVAAIVLIVVLATREQPLPVTAVRHLPVYAAPGEIIPVQITVTREQAAGEGLIIKEKLPPGWRLVKAIPEAASEHGANDEIKWLIPGGSGSLTIYYTLSVPPTSTEGKSAAVSGSLVLNAGSGARTVASGGDRTVTVGGYHWADRNGDYRIDDDEIMPAYYLTEAMKGLGLDWKITEAIWSGKGYRWDQAKKEFQVVK